MITALLLFQMYESIRQFYHSREWARCRDSYRKKRRGLCERCLKKGFIVPGDEVHHKKRLTKDNINDPRISLNFENLELLCKKCHEEEHHGVKRYRVDPRTGAVIPLHEE